MNEVEITIKNWDRFNPKRDQKTYTWLRLSNDLLTDPDLFGLDPAQKFAWIGLLCVASKKNSQTVVVSLDWLSHQTGVSVEDIEHLIEVLESKQVITVSRPDAAARGRALSCTRQNTTPTYVRTNVRTKRTKDFSSAESAAADVTCAAESDRTRSHDVVTTTPEDPKPPKAVTGPTWEAYSLAYHDKYGTDPVRNLTVNSQLAQFVKRLGADEAPHVAKFYLSHRDSFYAKAMHSVGLMLRDAEKLRTEWKTNTQVTASTIRVNEKTQHAIGQLERFERELEQLERGEA